MSVCRRLIAVSLVLAVLSGSAGCALFSGHKSAETPEKEATVFDQQRSEQDKMSEFAASAGRANPKEKKKVDPGQTFLLSSKAKEIYNNTER